MTDEQMDARLRAAGEAWRAAAAPVAEIAPAEPHALTPDVQGPRRRRTGLLASAAAVAAAVVAGGTVLLSNLSGNAHRAADTTAPLEQTVWQFVGYGDHVDRQSFSTMYISSAGRLVADDECELISAQASPSAARINVSGVVERLKGCVDTYQPAFGRGLDLLKSDPEYAIGGGGLTIGTGANAMHFLPTRDLPAPTLDVPMFTDTDWRLVSATDAAGTTSGVGGDLLFRVQDGRYTADEGCNKLSGELISAGSRADIQTVRSTTLPCPSPQPYEQVIQAVFQRGTVDVQMRGAELTIKRDGAGSLTYKWVPSDPDATRPSALIGHNWQLSAVAGQPAAGSIGLYAGPAEITVTFGCGATGGTADIGPGTLHIDGISGGPAPGCSGDIGDQSATIDSIVAGEALWRVDDGKLIVFGGTGAQGFALVFTSSDPAQPADVPLTGTAWSLTKILDADKHELPVAGDAKFQIDEGGHVTGNDSCNLLSGEAQLTGNTLDFGAGLGGTEIGCPTAQNATAEHIRAILSGRTQWTVDGDQLAITKDGVGTLVYRAASAPVSSTDPNDLIGVTWDLTTIESGTGPSAVAHSVIGDAGLRIDGGLQYTDGCNTYSGNATVGNGTLDVAVETGSGAGCIGALGQQAEEIAAVLKGHLSWVIDGGRLTVTKDGTGALVFSPHAAASGLAGTTWTLQAIQPGGASNGAEYLTDDAVHFDGAGHVEITHRCYLDSGEVRVQGATLDISNVVPDGTVSCPGTPSRDAEQAADQTMDEVLTGQSTWTITATGRLLITKGGTTLVFGGESGSGGGGAASSATPSGAASSSR